jgi:D-sedoheptulose 7-phosphate isomerase
MKTIPHAFDEYLVRLQRAVNSIDTTALDAAVEILMQCYLADGAIYVVGNGGSASTATHMACDLSKGPTSPGKRGLAVWSLTDNPALLTALANDISYEEVFAVPILSRVKSHDVLIAVSASGNSPNLVRGLQAAKQKGCRIIAFTGFSGGYLKQNADVVCHVEGDTYGPVEDAHLVINHYFVEAIRQRMALEAMPV